MLKGSTTPRVISEALAPLRTTFARPEVNTKQQSGALSSSKTLAPFRLASGRDIFTT